MHLGKILLQELSNRSVVHDDVVILIFRFPSNENITRYIWKIKGETVEETSAQLNKTFRQTDLDGNVSCAAILSDRKTSQEIVAFVQFYGELLFVN